MIQDFVATLTDDPEKSELQALLIEELRQIHEGVLARYGLRPSQWEKWKHWAETY